MIFSCEFATSGAKVESTHKLQKVQRLLYIYPVLFIALTSQNNCTWYPNRKLLEYSSVSCLFAIKRTYHQQPAGGLF